MSEVETAKTKAAAAPKRFKLTIHAEAEGGDKGDVLLGHNYKLIQVRRGVEVEVDEVYIDVLKGSLIDTHVKRDDGKMHPVKVPRYSYTYEPA